MGTQRIAILAYEGCMAMEVFGLCDTLLLANRVAAAMAGTAPVPPLFELCVSGVKGGAVLAAGGFPIGVVKPPRRIDLLVVPGWDLVDRQGGAAPLTRLAPELRHIRRVFAKGTPVASVCVGAFLLGEAGLLDGRKATTSWLFAPDLARRFPAARVEPNALLLEDGGVLTTGAFSAAFDLALHLIRQAAEPRVARAVARMALLEPRRHSQAAFVDARMLGAATGTGAGRFSDNVRAWLRARLPEPYDLAALAAVFHVSARTLLRRFKAETGESPLNFLQGERIEQAKTLLESGTLSVARITEQVGYADVGTFSGLFKRVVQQSPAEYRRRFRVAG